MTADKVLEMARELNDRREPYALITVVRAVAPTSAYIGAQAIILADGTLHGWIGGGCAKDVVIGAARNAIALGEPKLVRISNDRLQPEDDVEQYTMSCASNGTIELFIQPYSPRSALCVLGSTPAADEARFLAERLRIRLTDTPDEAPVVLVATQGQGDEDALERALKSRAMHVLMIASRRKTEKLRDAMRVRGVGEAELARLVAPAGPDAGAKTPGEIALVAIVGVLAVLRGRAQPHTDAQIRLRSIRCPCIDGAPATKSEQPEDRRRQIRQPGLRSGGRHLNAETHRALRRNCVLLLLRRVPHRIPPGAREICGDLSILGGGCCGVRRIAALVDSARGHPPRTTGREASEDHSLHEPGYSREPRSPAIVMASTLWQAVTPEPH